MPPNNLPLTGVRALVEDMRQFLKDQDTIEKKVKQTSDSIKKSTEKTKGFGSILDSASKDLNKFIGGLVQGIPGGHAFAGSLDTITASLSTMSIGVVAAIAAIAALVVAFFALGARGAPIKGLAESFDIQVRRIGLSSAQLLEDLDTAARGTVSRLELIRSANVALAGAVGKFGQEFGKNLPKLLEIARVQARATGQSVDYLFNSLVTGIKRSSPLLIDNTGLVLKVGEANERYAESIGKTVEQLTAEEKQIALLQATLTAGATATEALGGAQEGAAEKISRAQATISNILDTLALAIQPLYEAILDVINGVLTSIQSVVNALAPYIQIIAQVLGGIVSVIGGILKTVIDLLIKGLGPASQLIKLMFMGGAAIFGAFANAILQVANNLIFPAVIGIAKFIADFLVGGSPPPMGPLKDIDKGGAAVMESWLQGLTGIALDPVKDVAKFVADTLGAVGGLSRAQLEKRLLALDAALKPFEQRLTIIKARFEELQAPAQAALNAIDRQTEGLLEKAMLGDTQAAAQLRTLEAQRELIEGQVDAQQQLVDQAEIQFALAKARQARERSLLQLRLDQLGVAKKAGKKEKEGGGAKAPKDKALTGEAPIAEPGPSGITPVGEAEASTPLDLLAGVEAGQTLEDIMAQFEGQIAPGSLETFDANLASLQTQVSRIESADIGDRLFGGLGDSINALFDPANPTSIPALISNIDLGASISAVGTALQPLADLFDPNIQGSPMNTLKGLVDDIINPENPNSIPYKVGSLGGQIVSQLDRTKVSFAYFIDSIFNKEREGSPAYILNDFVQSIIDPEREGSVPYSLGQLGTNIATAVTDIGATIQTSIIDPIAAFLTGQGPNTISGIISETVGFFIALPGRILNALRSFGSMVWSAIVVPIVQVVNGIIDAVESGLKTLVQSVIDAISPIVTSLQQLGIDPSFFSGLISGLEATRDSINFGRIQVAMPAFLSEVPGGGIDNSVTFNSTFNGVAGANDAVRRFAGLRAGGV